MSERNQALQPSSGTQEIDLPNAQFSVVTNQVVGFLTQLSKVAEKGPINLLLTLGTALLVVAILLKLEFRGGRLSYLTPAEFIVMVIAGILLLFFGSALRFYQERINLELARRAQQIGGEMLKEHFAVAKDTHERGTHARMNMG
jgi:uncharacterized membrane protein